MRLADIAHATAFLTRLPVPSWAFGSSTLDFSRQCWTFPLVALPLGLIGWAVASGSIALTGSATIAGVAGVSALILATGALHEDGLADCADGFWGSSQRPGRMAIMRDSAVGTYGVLALVTVFMLRVTAVATLLAAYGIASGCALLAAIAFGRTALVWHWVALPPAPRTEEGAKGASLATRFGTPGTGQAVAASILCAALLLPVALVFEARLALALLLGAVTVLAFSLVARAKIGGYAGDTLGAASLLGETAFLCGLLGPTSVP